MTVDLFVCITCQQDEARPGIALLEALKARAGDMLRLHPVECLSVCQRPCTVAVSAPNKWTYIVGGLNESLQDELLDYIRTYAASEHGTPPLKERPVSIRRGTIARIPPLQG